MKCYCSLSDFNKGGLDLLKNNGIDITINNTKDRPTGNQLVKLIKEYDIIIVGIASKFTPDMLKYVTKPLIIATLSVGVDHIDKTFFESDLVKIINIKTSNSISVAEHIFSLILALNKRICESNLLVERGLGHKSNLNERPEDISLKTLGLIGAGNISKEVIKIAKAFNMNIKCYTKNPSIHHDLDIEFTSLDDLLKTSDIVSINIPLTDETKMLISEEKINLLKSNATFINTSRAEIVDIEALINYAEKHDTFYVGLDIDLDNYKELFMENRKNVIVTPHIAGVSKQAIARMDMEIANRIINEI